MHLNNRVLKVNISKILCVAFMCVKFLTLIIAILNIGPKSIYKQWNDSELKSKLRINEFYLQTNEDYPQTVYFM